MAYNWQLWLSPRPTQRTKFVQEPAFLTAGELSLYEFPLYNGHRVAQETHYISNKAVREGKSAPPLHLHLRQTETFLVEKGVLCLVRNGVQVTVKKEDGPVTIPPGVRHKFWSHESSTEDLIFKVWDEPEDVEHGFGESFLRNFGGYLRDCEESKISPSIFQIILFLFNSEILLTPPFWLPIWLLVGVHHILGYWVGGRLLGYKASYPEYSNLTKAQSH